MPGKESDFPSRKERKRLANQSPETGIALSAGADVVRTPAEDRKNGN